MAKIKLDDVEYDTEDMSDNAKAQLASLQFNEAHINRLKNELAIADTAKIAYVNALKRELIEELNHNFMSIKKFIKIFYKKDKMECYIYFINTNNKKFALKEGQEYNFFLLNDILLGSIYSKITKKSHNLTFITYKAIKRLKLQGSK